MIGFDRTDYTVNEGMSVTLVARVFEGTITQPVVVSVSTADGTATSEYVLTENNCLALLSNLILIHVHTCISKVGLCRMHSP